MGLTQDIEKTIRAAHDGGTFDGAALVARGRDVLYRGTFGDADRERHVRHGLNRPFPICSITKQFTALLVFQQIKAGKLKLDLPVSNYASFLPRTCSYKITLKNLMMHTSGLPDWADIPGILESPDARLQSPRFVLETYYKGDPEFEPGTKFRYNNADYLVLAAILEDVTGKPFAALLKERITDPLGMKNTGVYDSKNPVSVVGYEKKPAGFVPFAPAYRLENFGAAGAMYSTVDDLLRWDRALDDDRLLSRPLRETMYKSDPKLGYTACGTWVYGYQPYGKKTPVLYERQGAIGAYCDQNLRVPEDKISIILLSNVDTAQIIAYTGKSLTCDILRILYGGA